MKDIKELIYAAVEENALKFQEIVNNQLQVRAYEAIESLRPEIGASMFGESSHKKMDDEDEEEMEDEDEDEEDEDEMDDKKKSMKEALHPNQQKIDVVDDEKIDAKDFAKLHKTKNEETQKNIFRNPKLPAKDQLKNPPKQIKVEEVEQIDEIGNTPAGRAALGKLAAARDGRADWARGVAKHGSVGSDAAKHNALADKDRAVAKKAAGKAGIDHRTSPSTNYDHDKHGGYGTDKPNPADKFAARNKPKMEEVEQFDEKIEILRKDPNPQGDTVGTPVRYPKGHSAHGDAHRAATAKAAKVARTQGRLKGNDYLSKRRRDYEPGREHEPYAYGSGRVSKPKPKMEEVEQFDEKVKIFQRDQNPQGDTVGTPVRYPKGHSAHGDAHRAATAKAAKASRREGSLKGSDKSTWRRHSWQNDNNQVHAGKEVGEEVEDKVVADKVRTRGSFKFFSKKKLPGSDKSSMNEVAMPQNAADWQALITHQIKTTGHPVATDAQFRAQHGKDETKIASQDPPKDKLNYAAAQGGTVKR